MAFASDKGRQGAAGVSTGEYDIPNSLRFNDDDSAYLSWTPSSAGNRRTWTWSAWVKRGNLGVVNYIFHAYSGNSDDGFFRIEFNGASDQIRVRGWGTTYLQTNAVYRDTSAWYHIVLVADTSQSQGSATESDSRIRLYVNGEQVTSFASSNMRSQDFITPVNNNTQHNLSGKDGYSTGDNLDAYLAEVNFIDGFAKTPSDFGETDATYGHWKAKKYTHSDGYGDNGFYLDFKASGTLGNDVSGNDNDWTVNNLTDDDQMLDSPTNNFASWNVLDADGNANTFSEGNLKVVVSAQNTNEETRATFSQSSGKWYWEHYLISTTTTAGYFRVGLKSDDGDDYWLLRGSDGETENNGSNSTSSVSYSTTDVVGIAVDLDNSKWWMSVNGTWVGSPTAGTGYLHNNLSGTLSPYVSNASSGGTHTGVANFGQDSSFAGASNLPTRPSGSPFNDGEYGDFYYEPPSGFKALCTKNLADPAVVPKDNFNTVLYTGTGSSQSITGVGFQPDWVWTKGRSVSYSHYLFDSVRGVQNRLMANHTNAEGTVSSALTSFDSDGFTHGGEAGMGNNTDTFVAWNWKAGNETLGTGAFTQGTIASTCSRNVAAGFSIVSYTGNSTTDNNYTVGHGLSSAPEMVIIKNRDWASSSKGWAVWHDSISTGGVWLDSTDVTEANNFNYFYGSQPTANTFSVRADTSVSVGNRYRTNGNGDDYIAYAFHSVDGYSKVGSYTGNGSTDGTFVYTGFKPAYVMIKPTASGRWLIMDSERNVYNPLGERLFAESSVAESPYTYLDFTSNGFKLRYTGAFNTGTLIYLAFAEHPFKYSTAR